MTREEAIERIKEHMLIHHLREPRAIHITEALRMAIHSLQKETSEDCISRQAAIDAAINSTSNVDITLVPGEFTRGYLRGKADKLDELLNVLIDLPPVQHPYSQSRIERERKK